MKSTHTPAEQVATLEKLLSISAVDATAALIEASDIVATAFRADKVDVFLHDRSRDTIVAVGSSTQPLSALQKKLGLDMLPIANGGRIVEVFVTGKSFVSGAIDADPGEVRGIREALHVRSEVGVTLSVGDERRGVLVLASLEPDLWDGHDAKFAETVGSWVSAVLRQSEMVKELAASAAASARRMAAEELVTVLAHDVRNLIYPVDLAMHVLQRRAERDRRAEDVRDANKARRGLARLSAMVTDILDVAKIEQGLMRLELRPVALVPLVSEIASMLSTPDRPVVVHAREETQALIDPARLRQCIENIVANAVKHSPPQAPVNIVIEQRLGPAGGTATITITDSGPGIAADVLPHIFDRFVTGGAKQGTPGAGLGLGLFLARQIALLHGGDVTVAPLPSVGARFAITLPCEMSDVPVS